MISRIIFIFAFMSVILTGYAQGVSRVTVSASGDTKKPNNEVVTYYFLEGVKVLLQGDVKMASNVFDQVLQIAPDHAPTLLYKARLAYQARSFDDAKRFMLRALAVDSLDVDYLSNYARMQVETNDVEGALESFSKLKTLDSLDRETWYFIPILHYLRGDKEQSLKEIDNFEHRFGFDDRLYEIKRDYFVENRQFDQLNLYTQKVLAVDPTNVDKLIHAAQVEAAHNRDSEALSYYNRAIEVGGGQIAPYVALSDFYRIKRNVKGFAKTLEKILSSDVVLPKFKSESFITLLQLSHQEVFKSGVYDSLALSMVDSEIEDEDVVKLYLEYLVFRGNMSSAVEFGDKLYEQNRLSQGVSVLYLQLMYQAKMVKRATEVAYQLTKKWPKNLELSGLSSHLFTLEKDNKKALEVINSAVKMADNDSLKSVAYGMRGDFYYQLKQPNKYYADYAKALQLYQDNAVILNNLAYFMALDGKDLNQALLYAKRANELSDQNPTYLDTQAWVNYLMGRYDEAKRLMQLVFVYEKAPSFDMYLHYGDILYALGDDFLSRENWNKALNSGADPKEVRERLAKPKAVK